MTTRPCSTAASLPAEEPARSRESAPAVGSLDCERFLQPARRAYPSDVTDFQWSQLEPLLAEPDSRTGRRCATDLREVVSAIHYRWRTGCAWRMLPHDFPPWETVYTYYRRWNRQGRLSLLRATLLDRRTS